MSARGSTVLLGNHQQFLWPSPHAHELATTLELTAADYIKVAWHTTLAPTNDPKQGYRWRDGDHERHVAFCQRSVASGWMPGTICFNRWVIGATSDQLVAIAPAGLPWVQAARAVFATYGAFARNAGTNSLHTVIANLSRDTAQRLRGQPVLDELALELELPVDSLWAVSYTSTDINAEEVLAADRVALNAR